jgi:hypothetical protein
MLTLSSPEMQAFIAFLGLPKYTTAFQLQVRVGEMPIVHATFYPEEPKGTNWSTVDKTFMLMPLETVKAGP